METTKNKQYTILTEPATHLQQFSNAVLKIKQSIKLILSYVVYKEQWRHQHPVKYGGHESVTRSVIEGLEKLGILFNYNPKHRKDIAQTVFVLAGNDTLRYALKLKEKGLIKKIIAGPNIAVLPDEITNIQYISLLDIYVQPSTWVVDLWHLIDPRFPVKLKVWYAGVNTDFWKPSSVVKNPKHVLLYRKHVPEDFFISCKAMIEQQGFVAEVIYYGSYTKNQYFTALQRNSIVIHFTESESQGISLAEAWSTNTPTIVWNPKLFTYENVTYTESSSAPYLTNQTGLFFGSQNELESILSSWQPEQYSPRQWCVEHMSDEVSVKKLLGILEAQ